MGNWVGVDDAATESGLVAAQRFMIAALRPNTPGGSEIDASRGSSERAASVAKARNWSFWGGRIGCDRAVRLGGGSLPRACFP